MSHYKSEHEIETLVRDFESCKIDKTEFRHPQHLTVGAWYVQTMGREQALDRMRSGLFRFLDHHGVDKKKYDETITVYWIERIADKLNELGDGLPFVEKCNEVVKSMS
jgi:hypothetical protein